MSTYSSTSSSTSTASSVHKPEPIYNSLTSQAPLTVTSADGTVQHPGEHVREGVAGIGSTVNHALASVAHGVGNALGLTQATPAVVVTNHPTTAGQHTHTHTLQGTQAQHPSQHNTPQRIARSAFDMPLLACVQRPTDASALDCSLCCSSSRVQALRARWVKWLQWACGSRVFSSRWQQHCSIPDGRHCRNRPILTVIAQARQFMTRALS